MPDDGGPEMACRCLLEGAQQRAVCSLLFMMAGLGNPIAGQVPIWGRRGVLEAFVQTSTV